MEEKLFDGAFFSKLATLRMSSKMKMTAGMSGGRKSSMKGNSVEFSDFREYILGDDIRKIDWNAYGRMDRLFIKLFQEEKEGVFRIFVDGSKSMDYGEKKKSILARRIAGMLSYIVLNNLDRVYLTKLGDGALQPGKGMTGRQSFQKILLALENMTFEGNSSLYEGIQKCKISGHGITILISDFFNEEELEPMLRYLVYQKQEIILIHTLAAEEIDPDLEGHLNLIDMESRKDLRVSMSGSVLKKYQKTLHAFQERLIELSRKYQAHYMFVSTEDALDKFIFEGIRSGQLERL
ncbi:MAG: DUF58 domain-containing protein [Lachnospiraceae bacterium]|nr:DUF58 domain-containing protein [Lachnospiraceae bacterium]